MVRTDSITDSITGSRGTDSITDSITGARGRHLVHQLDDDVDEEAAEEEEMVNVVQVKLPSLETKGSLLSTNSDLDSRRHYHHPQPCIHAGNPLAYRHLLRAMNHHAHQQKTEAEENAEHQRTGQVCILNDILRFCVNASGSFVFRAIMEPKTSIVCARKGQWTASNQLGLHRVICTLILTHRTIVYPPTDFFARVEHG